MRGSRVFHCAQNIPAELICTPGRVKSGGNTRVEETLEQVTAARVKAHFGGVVEGCVVRYELPRIGALNFVMTQTLGGGVTRSLALDAHGKSLSSALLDLEIELPPDNK